MGKKEIFVKHTDYKEQNLYISAGEISPELECFAVKVDKKVFEETIEVLKTKTIDSSKVVDLYYKILYWSDKTDKLVECCENGSGEWWEFCDNLLCYYVSVASLGDPVPILYDIKDDD